MAPVTKPVAPPVVIVSRSAASRRGRAGRGRMAHVHPRERNHAGTAATLWRGCAHGKRAAQPHTRLVGSRRLDGSRSHPDCTATRTIARQGVSMPGCQHARVSARGRRARTVRHIHDGRAGMFDVQGPVRRRWGVGMLGWGVAHGERCARKSHGTCRWTGQLRCMSERIQRELCAAVATGRRTQGVAAR